MVSGPPCASTSTLASTVLCKITGTAKCLADEILCHDLFASSSVGRNILLLQEE